MRHEFFDRILNENKSVHYVIKNLAAANFDPELYTRFEQSIQKAFESQYPQQI